MIRILRALSAVSVLAFAGCATATDWVWTEQDAVARATMFCPTLAGGHAEHHWDKWYVTNGGVGLWINASDGDPSDIVGPDAVCLRLDQRGGSPSLPAAAPRGEPQKVLPGVLPGA